MRTGTISSPFVWLQDLWPETNVSTGVYGRRQKATYLCQHVLTPGLKVSKGVFQITKHFSTNRTSCQQQANFSLDMNAPSFSQRVVQTAVQVAYASRRGVGDILSTQATCSRSCFPFGSLWHRRPLGLLLLRQRPIGSCHYIRPAVSVRCPPKVKHNNLRRAST